MEVRGHGFAGLGGHVHVHVQRDQLPTPLAHDLQDVREVRQRARQPVQLGNDQCLRVTLAQQIQRGAFLRPAYGASEYRSSLKERGRSTPRSCWVIFSFAVLRLLLGAPG